MKKDISSRIAALSPQMREALAARLRGAAKPSDQRMKRAERSGHLALSSAEARMWFLDRFEPNTATYNIMCALRLHGSIDIAAINRALTALVARHEALRTRYATDANGVPHRIIDAPAAVDLSVRQLGELPNRDAVREYVNTESQRPFNLATGPLFRAALGTIAPDDSVLLLAMHHIVADGWSIDVLQRDLAALYAAERSGETVKLAPLSVQYADYAGWQRQRLTGEAANKHIAHWKRHLAGVPPLELSTDRPRPAKQTFAGASHRFEIAAPARDALRALARKEGVTQFMLLLAAVEVLLHRYSGQADFAIGTPVAGRTHAELEPLVGLFVNTLALRADLSGDPTFRMLLARVREETLGAYAHEELPFDRIVEELQLERDPSRSPVFQVSFSLQTASERVALFGDATMAPEPVDPGVSKFDLSVFFIDRPDGLRAIVDYNTSLFDAETIARMGEHLDVLLTAIAEKPDERVSRLPLMTAAEREQTMVTWNDTDTAGPREREMCVHKIFAEHVRARPDAPAVALNGRVLTYAEVDAHAESLARWLRAHGARRNSFVAVCMPRSLEMVVAQLAVLKAGSAFVSLDPANPPDRLARMLSEVRVEVVLTSDAVRAQLPAGEMNCVALDLTHWEWTASDPSVATGESPTLDDAAYVVFTSGSTGVPKAVVVEHRGLTNLMNWHQRICPLAAGDVAAQLAGPAFDASVWEIWTYLASGALMVIVDDDLRLTPTLLTRFLIDHAVNCVFMPTPLGEACLTEDWTGAPLRTMFIGGDRLHPRTTLPPFQLVNAYGPAECSVVSTYALVTAATMAAPTIGRAIDNARVYVVDEHLQPTPIGVPGELLIAGAGLARGYTRPEATAERFVTDPFGAPGERVYRTGDIVRWTRAGEIEFLGRRDHQVKIRGQRIELGEIEAVLRNHKGVRDALVIAHGAAEKWLAGYVVIAPGTDAPTASDLREFVARALPSAMVPAAFVALDAWPLTPNGKIDRRALPSPNVESGAAEYVAPRSPTEQIVAAIWRDVLRVERVGALDDFFALGGHSLLVMQLVARVRTRLGAELPVRAVFDASTLAELASAIDAAVAAGRGARLRPVAQWDHSRLARASFSECHLFSFEKSVPGSTAWTISRVLELRGLRDAQAFRAAWQGLVDRHAILRTHFEQHGENLFRVIRPKHTIELEVIPHDAPTGNLRALAEAWVEREARFDVERGPLVKAVLFAVGPGHYVFVTLFHHLVSDATSDAVLWRELQELWRGAVAGAPPAFDAPIASELPEPALQYADFAEWQHTLHAEGAFDNDLVFWRDKLRGASPAPLPFGAEAQVTAAKLSSAAHLLSPELSAVIDDLQREALMLHPIVHAALTALVWAYSGERDVSIISPLMAHRFAARDSIRWSGSS